MGKRGREPHVAPIVRSRVSVAEAAAALAKSYPDDRATGFAVGDLRGVLWVELTKRAD